LDLKIGDMVRVYSLINPKMDLKGIYKIKYLGEMNATSGTMAWLEGLRGAWCLDALELVEKVSVHGS
jgi:hypothetical protein